MFKLELSGNHLTGEDLDKLVILYPKLYKVKLNENQINSIDELKGLKGSKINKIYVSKNPFIESNENYKKELFEMLPTLTAIDGEDKKGDPVNSTEYDEDDSDVGEEEVEGDEIEEEEEVDDDGDDGDDDDGEDDDDEDKPHKKHKH